MSGLVLDYRNVVKGQRVIAHGRVGTLNDFIVPPDGAVTISVIFEPGQPADASGKQLAAAWYTLPDDQIFEYDDLTETVVKTAAARLKAYNAKQLLAEAQQRYPLAFAALDAVTAANKEQKISEDHLRGMALAFFQQQGCNKDVLPAGLSTRTYDSYSYDQGAMIRWLLDRGLLDFISIDEKALQKLLDSSMLNNEAEYPIDASTAARLNIAKHERVMITIPEDFGLPAGAKKKKPTSKSKK